jgi:hypothetical protein
VELGEVVKGGKTVLAELPVAAKPTPTKKVKEKTA